MNVNVDSHTYHTALRIFVSNKQLKEVMAGLNDFNWETVDTLLENSASRKKHVAFSFFISWGNDGGSQLPDFLVDIVERIDLIDPNSGSYDGDTPAFGDANLLMALDNFIAALGERYDGDKRIAAIHLGLLGFWGEFHTFPYDPDNVIVPISARINVADWFFAAFSQTQIQARYPDPETNDRFGFYDGSFAHATVNECPNQGACQWFFLPRIEESNQELAWRNFMIAGETFPQLQEFVFDDTNMNPDYPAHFQQDFIDAATQIHASWVLHHNAFSDVYEGAELANALEAHAFLGYNFVVDRVELFYENGAIDMQVSLRQNGIAPWYYDLGLEVDCDGLPSPIVANGVESDLIGNGDQETYLFQGLPPSSQCVQAIAVRLVSSMLYPGQEIKFAQGVDGTVVLDAPLPPGVDPTPTVEIVPSASPSSSSAPLDVLHFIPSTQDSNGIYLDIDDPNWVFCNDPPTGPFLNTGDYDPSVFRCHRWTNGDLRYTISGLNPEVTHPMRLGFAENFGGNCEVGRRVFSVIVNGEPFVSNLDVYDEVGCYTAFWITRHVTTNAAGELELLFIGTADNGYVSFIEIGNELVSDVPAPTSMVPSWLPSVAPSSQPSLSPSSAPSSEPSASPVSLSTFPSSQPSSTPSSAPFSEPSASPVAPSMFPSSQPSSTPSSAPSNEPSASPVALSMFPSSQPSSSPSSAPSSQPSASPSQVPDSEPAPTVTGPSFESLVVASVSDTWQTVSLSATFTSPVVVCSIQYTGPSNVPAVVRINNLLSSSFEVRLQNPGDLMAITSGRPVHCVVMEEGVWELPDGRVVEAVQYTTTVTAYRNQWLAGVTSRPLAHTGFTTPVVYGQVMSYNDPAWSTFVTCGDRRQTVPTRTVVNTGKHTGEDSNPSRADEVVGYIVMERAVHMSMAGVEIEASRGDDIVRGFTQSPFSYEYNFVSPFANEMAPEVLLVSQNAMDGSDGSYAILAAAPSYRSVEVALDEDQIRDSERSHTTEQVAYLAISTAGVLPLTEVR